MVILFSVIWGVGFGMRTPTFHAMRGDFFGGKHYGTILGINAFPMGIGMMIAPVIVGYLYDTYDTYYYSFIVMAALCILSCILISIIKNPKNYEKKIKPIEQIADELGLGKESIELYGNYKAKIPLKISIKVKSLNL